MVSRINKVLSTIMISGLILTGCSSDKPKENEDLNIGSQIEQSSDNQSTQDDKSNLTGNKVTVSKLNEVRVNFINTGNSDAILINDDGKYILIDSGDNDDEKFIASYLKKTGVSELEYLIISHWDADHVGGADSVLDNIKVKNVLVPNGDADTKTYRDFIYSLSNAGLTPSVPLEGAKISLNNSYFEVFNTDGGNSKNDDSLVVKLTNGEDKFLFTGDAGKSIESKIKNKIGDIDVLKVGHHGSHTSTGYDFVKAITPEYAVILCDKENKYGHPHKETMDTLQNFNVEVHRSDECGDVEFISTGSGVVTSCEKGSYTPGKNSKYSSNKAVTPKKDETFESNIEEFSNQQQVGGDVVYWTPKGKSYHTTKDCSALSRSKTILSGTQAESGKNDPCDRCH